MKLEHKSFEIEFAGRPLSIEVSQLGEQANAAVVGKYGDTVVLATAVMGKEDRAIDYMPLTVDYEERFYSVGKIMGGRMQRREGKAADAAVLSGRLIDRTIRPLFDQRLRRDIQVVVTILSFDEENSHQFVGLLAASCALAISDIPWGEPVAGVEVAKIDGVLVVNPNLKKMSNAGFKSFVSGTADRINMLELEALQAPEADVVAGMDLAQKEIAKLVEFQNSIIKKIGKPKATVELQSPEPVLVEKVNGFILSKLDGAIYVKDKVERQNNLDKIKTDLRASLTKDGATEKDLMIADQLLENAIDEVVHKNILESNRRPDGRKLNELRKLYAETHLFTRLHGSALFVRGNTQALAVTTLAAPDFGQLIEGIDYTGTKNFLLNYNFPHYSVGEIGAMRGPGRREIGHGALAEKAVKNLIPSKEEFPYTIRVVSEILSSNGSSSMATVCASTLSLMDAGVPIKKPAAGIAMGLMTGEKDDYKILTDIQGPEDHYGDMDFKVAGTADGITAAQLDVKIHGLTTKMIAETLAQAREARLQILEVMAGALSAPRGEVSVYAPVIRVIKINPEKIGFLVGPGGKNINALIARTGVSDIKIEQTGEVYVTAPSKAIADSVAREISDMTRVFKVGDIVTGPIVKILDFGAIVDLGGGNDGMIHVSELKEGFVKKVEDVVKLGDQVTAKVVRAEEGRIGLSLKGIPQLK